MRNHYAKKCTRSWLFSITIKKLALRILRSEHQFLPGRIHTIESKESVGALSKSRTSLKFAPANNMLHTASEEIDWEIASSFGRLLHAGRKINELQIGPRRRFAGKSHFPPNKMRKPKNSPMFGAATLESIQSQLTHTPQGETNMEYPCICFEYRAAIID